jgi:hypothetical protein
MVLSFMRPEAAAGDDDRVGAMGQTVQSAEAGKVLPSLAVPPGVSMPAWLPTPHPYSAKAWDSHRRAEMRDRLLHRWNCSVTLMVLDVPAGSCRVFFDI